MSEENVTPTMMPLESVISFLDMCKENNIKVYLDGGWGVDALIGRQTREHSDLDVGVPREDAEKLNKILKEKGFTELARHDSSAYNYVLMNRSGHQIDIHSYEFDEQGQHIWGIGYPVDSLTGKGVLSGRDIDCISAEWAVKFRCNYEPDERDYRDVKLLCTKFGIELPEEYQKFKQQI